MGKNSHKDNWRKQRKIFNRELRGNNIYIFSEGSQTEPNYFKRFKQIIEKNPIYKNMIFINIHPCKVGTTKILDEAKKYIKTNNITKGQIWLVYDKDNFPDFDDVPKLASECSTTELSFNIAWSNQCFELWFILHFENYQVDNPRSEYSKFLDRKFNNLKLGNYEKNRTDIFDILLEKGYPRQAIKFAKTKIEKNKGLPPSKISPGTTAYKLVEELAKYFPDDIKEKFID